jgi:hypothetical protein
MDAVLRRILFFLLRWRCIGAKHTPEDKVITSRTKWMNRYEKDVFQKEYDALVGQDFILRAKKRTGKGSDWHICINPKKLKELYGLLDEQEGEDNNGKDERIL